MNEFTGVAADAATILFNLPDYHVVSTTISAGRRQVIVETVGCAIDANPDSADLVERALGEGI